MVNSACTVMVMISGHVGLLKGAVGRGVIVNLNFMANIFQLSC